MTYTITLHNVWSSDDEDNSTLHSENAYLQYEDRSYAALNEGQFTKILKDELDIPDYAVNAENIKKEFGCDGSISINDECIDRIIKYYKFRKDLYSKIVKNFTCGAAELMLKNLNADEARAKYYIPYYGNTFSCEDPEYDGGYIESWIEIEVSK